MRAFICLLLTLCVTMSVAAQQVSSPIEEREETSLTEVGEGYIVVFMKADGSLGEEGGMSATCSSYVIFSRTIRGEVQIAAWPRCSISREGEIVGETIPDLVLFGQGNQVRATKDQSGVYRAILPRSKLAVNISVKPPSRDPERFMPVQLVGVSLVPKSTKNFDLDQVPPRYFSLAVDLLD